MATLEERFWAKVEKSDGCWLWVGAKTASGYGIVWMDRGVRYAHRVAWETQVGPIPSGLQVDHLCRVRACVNPAHLEPVTPRENTLRGESFAAVEARRTHCPQGHPYAGENLIVEQGSRLNRRCLACRRAKDARRHARELAGRASVKP